MSILIWVVTVLLLWQMKQFMDDNDIGWPGGHAAKEGAR